MTTAPDIWLVAHDLTELGDAAAGEAARLCARSGGKMLLLHIHPQADLNLPSYERTGERTFEIEKEIRQKLEGVVKKLAEQNPGLNASVEVLAGDATERILSEADRIPARHIVLGTHNRKGLKRAVLGSVAEAVVHSATVPVLVVKGPAKA